MSNEEKARKAVDDIVSDLTDRSGLDGGWDSIDDDIQEEIKAEWVKIILRQLNTK